MHLSTFPTYGEVGVNQNRFGRYELLLKDQNCVTLMEQNKRFHIIKYNLKELERKLDIKNSCKD